jgi:pimeloyl-ACP methyl ester carboxylesterase
MLLFQLAAMALFVLFFPLSRCARSLWLTCFYVRASLRFGNLHNLSSIYGTDWNSSVPSIVVKAISRQAEIPTAIEYGALLRSSGAAVRLVVGEHDQLTPASCAFRIFGSAGPRAKLSLLEGDVGHQVMAERGDAINNLLVEMCKDTG